MFRTLLLSSLALAVGCGINAKNFDDEYQARWCTEWQGCNEEFSCELELEHDRDACEFDKDKADECLNGPWTCDNSNTGLSVLLQPAACEEVWSCPAGDATATGNTTSSTTGGTTGTTTSS